MMRALWLALILVMSCGVPQDIAETTQQALARGSLRVGAIAGSELISGGQPEGIEARAVSGFADEMGLTVEWSVGAEHDLMEKLEKGQLDVVIGGLTKKSPWRRQVALSEEISPSEEEPPVMAVRSGENRWLLEIDRWLRQQS